MSVIPVTMSAGRTTVIGGLLIALGSVSMAIYTPAMPALVLAFGTSMAMVKSTLTAYFAGFALAQLVCGPLSDGYGRRPIAGLFLVLYVAGSVVAMLASSIEVLIAARLLQGIGAAVGVAVARAVVRDLFVGQQSAQVMNAIGIMLAIGPAVAPTIGGIVLDLSGWHAIFVVMAAVGLAAMAMVGFAMPETNLSRDPARARPGRVLATYGQLIVDRRFIVPAVTMGTAIGVFYALGTILPFVLIDRVGLTPTHFGFGMLAQTGSYTLGGLVTRRLMAVWGAERLVLPGLIFGLLGALATAALGHGITPTYATVMIPIGIFAFAAAAIMPDLTTRALAPFAETAGSASALLGFIQMGAGFVGGLAATAFVDPVNALGTIFPAMLTIAFATHLLGLWWPKARV
ncbi:Bcr/CflA family efflux MFS transporter [Siculibacillus lacustris]|uniref:Bcr/CflA family efflux transporter n=1 Tax=Siculibacillus lacustris TaxID=1549641 RepID=A0A4V2KT96_9HYPH|nr:multidrug effflux MFS transporter [Siculibacillus lacustris]TBW36306.1 Bcr/CflA family efflux MFS transporter [Siculibacillus lacustris]